MPATPSYRWPLLTKRLGRDVVVKHENHTPTGAFKIRGGITYIDSLKQQGPLPKGVVTATRGNHGQSIARAASNAGIPATIVVPENNSIEKNAAMQAFGAELIISGKDFDESRLTAEKIQQDRGYHAVPAFHRSLVLGVATYAWELFSAFNKLDIVYVPIGMGSGISGLISVRNILGLKTEIVGVVSKNADAFKQSFDSNVIRTTENANTFADGMACRQPHPESFKVVQKGAARIISVDEDEIANAIRILHTDTHNLAEGAGAATLAALIQEGSALKAKQVGVILTGGNIDLPMQAEILNGSTPCSGVLDCS